MKKIIRLTESDLNRIVRRVIMEQGPTMSCDQSDLKAKFFYDDKLTKLAFNATIFTRRMVSDGVSFQFKIAGEGQNRDGFVGCGKNYTIMKGNKFYFTPDALKIILCNCNDYVSSGVNASSNV